MNKFVFWWRWTLVYLPLLFFIYYISRSGLFCYFSSSWKEKFAKCFFNGCFIWSACLFYLWPDKFCIIKRLVSFTDGRDIIRDMMKSILVSPISYFIAISLDYKTNNTKNIWENFSDYEWYLLLFYKLPDI